jgi:hypothetical protein
LQHEITHKDISYVVERIGEFDADNRAALNAPFTAFPPFATGGGISLGSPAGWVEAVYGTIDIITDLVESGKSILILGRRVRQDNHAARSCPHPGGEKTRDHCGYLQ